MNVTLVVLAFNQNFILPALTSIYSTIQHCSNLNRIEFFALYKSLNSTSIQLIEDFIRSCGSFITFVNCSQSLNDYTITSNDPTRPLEIFYPLLIPKYFSSYKHALFLDSDLLIRDDILKIIDAMPINKKLGAVRDTYHNHPHTSHMWGFEDYTKNVLKIKKTKNYFNSGVLLFNMSLTTRDEATACLDFIQHQWNGHDEATWQMLQQALAPLATRLLCGPLWGAIPHITG